MEKERIRGLMESASPSQVATLNAMGVMVELTNQIATLENVAEDVAYMKIVMVNVCFIGRPQKSDWVLVDGGLPEAAAGIKEAAKHRFGCKPKAIILTHGHFDHIGAIPDLIKEWDIPVYAHQSELPFIKGQADYPPPDPGVSDGLLAKISPLYPNQAVNLGENVKPLPSDGNLPNLPGWRWIHTPGHTPGHISLFREEDRLLVAGDAFVTVEQESALAVLTQDKEVHGPPAYFTPDWKRAGESVTKLMELKPSVAVTGHGLPMRGDELTRQLEQLAKNFDKLAVPEQGKYVH